MRQNSEARPLCSGISAVCALGARTPWPCPSGAWPLNASPAFLPLQSSGVYCDTEVQVFTVTRLLWKLNEMVHE